MAASQWIIDVEEREFEKQVVERSKEAPILLDFWAEWCGPCKMLTPELERLAEEFAGRFILAKVNIDKNPGLAQDFGVASIPTIVAVVDGQIAGQFTGVLPKSQIVELLNRICPTEADRLTRQAAKIESDQPAQAEQLYRTALALDPELTTAKAGLAHLSLQAGRLEEARSLVETIGEGTDGAQRAKSVRDQLMLKDVAGSSGGVAECEARVRKNPNDLEARRELGLALAAAERFQEALETLVEIVEADRVFGAEKVKAEMVKIFGIVGPQSELAIRYRPRLANALY